MTGKQKKKKHCWIRLKNKETRMNENRKWFQSGREGEREIGKREQERKAGEISS